MRKINKVRTTLLISTYNQADILNLCLKSLLCQTIMPDEIIIADDGSSDNTVEIVQMYRKKINIPIYHIWHTDKGFRKTLILNTALKHATGNYIIQIDGDIIMSRNFIADHIRVSEKGFFVRGTRSKLNKQVTEKIISTGEIGLKFFSKGVENRINSIRIPCIGLNFSKKKNNGYSVRGCNFAYWFDDYINVNGYNNDLNGWGNEDEELAWRFINSGIQKKIVKLCAIEFHLYHNESSLNNEFKHRQIVNKVIESKEYRCRNGYNEINK